MGGCTCTLHALQLHPGASLASFVSLGCLVLPWGVWCFPGPKTHGGAPGAGRGWGHHLHPRVQIPGAPGCANGSWGAGGWVVGCGGWLGVGCLLGGCGCLAERPWLHQGLYHVRPWASIPGWVAGGGVLARVDSGPRVGCGRGPEMQGFGGFCDARGGRCEPLPPTSFLDWRPVQNGGHVYLVRGWVDRRLEYLGKMTTCYTAF